jgi:hypothetical protein
MRDLLIASLMVLLTAPLALGFESGAFQVREDFGTDPLNECYINYYYYIPCPSSSWFWWFHGWEPRQVVGAWFQGGDPSMTASTGCPPYVTCDPTSVQSVSRFRVLDYAGYGTVYPGLGTVEFNIWCCDGAGCPVGPAIWGSGPMELCSGGWNYISVNPPVSVAACNTVPDPAGHPRFLITATNVGSQPNYPKWGFDNISKPLSLGCQMHDYGCCPALYPRPSVSHYGTIHSGDYGVDFTHCPPRWFADPGDLTGSEYGYLELAWRVYMPAHPSGFYDITGFVRDASRRPVPGVTVALTGGVGGSTLTDSAGFYAFWAVGGGASYTVAPSMDYCDFNPASRTYPNLGQDYSNQNFSADCTAGVPGAHPTTWGSIKAIFR